MACNLTVEGSWIQVPDLKSASLAWDGNFILEIELVDLGIAPNFSADILPGQPLVISFGGEFGEGFGHALGDWMGCEENDKETIELDTSHGGLAFDNKGWVVGATIKFGEYWSFFIDLNSTPVALSAMNNSLTLSFPKEGSKYYTTPINPA